MDTQNVSSILKIIDEAAYNKDYSVVKYYVEALQKLVDELENEPKSGDAYEHTSPDGRKTIYILQKLPNFDAWCLVRMDDGNVYFWTGPTTLKECGLKAMKKVG